MNMTTSWRPPPSFSPPPPLKTSVSTAVASPSREEVSNLEVSHPPSSHSHRSMRDGGEKHQPRQEFQPHKPQRPNSMMAAAFSPPPFTTSSTTSPEKNTSKMFSWAPTFVVGSDDSHENDTSPNMREECDRPKSVVVMPTKQRRYQHHSLLSPISSPTSVTKSTTTTATTSPLQSPSWQSSVFVAGGDDETEDEDVTSHKGGLSDDESNYTRPDMEATMSQTRLEWNQHMLCKALLPYKNMIRALDPDNFPTTDDQHDFQSGHDGASRGLFRSYDEDSNSSEGGDNVADIRHAMMQDSSLNEREIVAFFEGMRLFQMKVDSLQAQLRVLSQRKTSMVFSTPTRSATMTPRVLTSMPHKRASIAAPSASWRPPLASVSDNEDNLSRSFKTSSEDDHQTDTTMDSATTPQKTPRAFSKSLRAMSIARIQNRVNAMQDDNDSTVNHSKGPLFDSSSNESTGRKEDIQRLLRELEEAEKKQRRLEKQLEQAGMVIAEDIPYDFAKEQVAVIAQRMTEIGSSDVEDPALKEEYFKLEKEMEKYTTALQLTDEWVQEQAELEHQWEVTIANANEEACRKVRRHMPVNVRNMSEQALTSQPSPNGKFLPQSIARKFKRTNCLMLLRIDPDDIVRMHPSTLENMRVTGLTLTERRAIYHHLKDVGSRWKAMQSDKLTERKWIWYSMMRSNFKENVDAWQQHVDKYGPPENHPHATRDNPHSGCPLIGKQCPIKADKVIDYDGDYGFPEGPEYFKTEVTKSEVDNVAKAKQEALEAAREKKGLERREALKRHYKGNLHLVTKAVGSCANMDATMDNLEANQEKQIRNELDSGSINGASSMDEAKKEVASFDEALNELKLSLYSFAGDSGMQLQGKRDKGYDKPDPRSMLELSLCEEVVEAVMSFFAGIDERMENLHIKDGRIKSSMQQLREVLDDLHTRNLESIEKLSEHENPPPPSRKLKTREAIRAQVRKERDETPKAADAPPQNTSSPPIPCDDARNGLMAGLKGKGRGDDGGRGSLMAAIAKRGGRGGKGGGRGDLMAAIAKRGTVE